MIARAPMKKWEVFAIRGAERIALGTVFETEEAFARCAALTRFGISEEEAEEGTNRAGIYPADDFEVEERS